MTNSQREHCLPVACWLSAEELRFSFVQVESGRVTFQLRVGCVRKSCMLIVSCLHVGKLRAARDLVARRKFSSCVHMGELRATRELAACERETRESCELAACWLHVG